MGLRDKYKNDVTTPALPAGVTPTPEPVRASAGRDLSALRARLAGNGQVNPPEATAALVDSLAAPMTRETAEGTEMIPEALPTPPVEAPKRRRRTKAEIEADAASAVVCPAAEPTTATPVSSAGESPTALAHGLGTPEYYRELSEVLAGVSPPTLIEVLTRIASALEVLSTRAL